MFIKFYLKLLFHHCSLICLLFVSLESGDERTRLIPYTMLKFTEKKLFIPKIWLHLVSLQICIAMSFLLCLLSMHILREAAIISYFCIQTQWQTIS